MNAFLVSSLLLDSQPKFKEICPTDDNTCFEVERAKKELGMDVCAVLGSMLVRNSMDNLLARVGLMQLEKILY